MRAILSNEDAVSELIGVILALGIAVLALTVIQTTSVPVWDGELEHAHNIVVYNDFMQLRANTFADSPDSAPIKMGFLYPNRILLRNPTNGVSGTIVTKNQTIIVHGRVGGGVEWAGNDTVEKLLAIDWAEYDLHANESSIGGSKLSYTFNSTNLSIDFWRTDFSGFASVSVDGVIYKQINLYIHSNQYTDFNGTLQTYPIVDGLDFGTHIAEVEIMGTRSIDSAGNSVIVDGFRPGVVDINEAYLTGIISYSADNNFAATPDIVMEHALVLKAYGGYAYTETSPQVTSDTIFLPLIQVPITSETSLESITIDTMPVDTIELLLIDADISFDTDYPDLWNSSIIPGLANSGFTSSLSGNTLTIHSNSTTRLIMPVIVVTIGGEMGGNDSATVGDATPPTIWFSTAPPIAPTITDKTKPLITANYSDTSGIDISSVDVYLDGVPTGNFTAYPDHVNYTPDPELEPGWHNVKIEVSDVFGNTGILTSNLFFVAIEPWVDIQSPTTASSVSVSRGFNTTVDFTYTDTNAKSYVVQINNSTSVIASVVKNVTQLSGINIPVSESIFIGAGTAVGSYDVWVWMNDTTGFTNSSLEVDALNVMRAQAEHLVLDGSNVEYGGGGDTRIERFSISNNATDSFDIVLDKVIISWSPNNLEEIERVRLRNGVTFWRGVSGYIPATSSLSGTTLDGTDRTIAAGDDYDRVRFYFDSDMDVAGRSTYVITFLLGDGSSRSIEFDM